MADEHFPVRRWWFPLRRVCVCGRWRPCPPSRVTDRQGRVRLVDGDRVPWPNNPAAWHSTVTSELPNVGPRFAPLLTPGQLARTRRRWV